MRRLLALLPLALLATACNADGEDAEWVHYNDTWSPVTQQIAVGDIWVGQKHRGYDVVTVPADPLYGSVQIEVDMRVEDPALERSFIDGQACIVWGINADNTGAACSDTRVMPFTGSWETRFSFNSISDLGLPPFAEVQVVDSRLVYRYHRWEFDGASCTPCLQSRNILYHDSGDTNVIGAGNDTNGPAGGGGGGGSW